MPAGAVDRRIVPLAPGFLSLVVVLGLARRQRRSTLPRSPSRRCSPRRPAIPRWNRDEPPRTLRVVEPRRVPAVRRRVALSSRSVATVCLLVLSDFQCSVFYHTSHTRKQTKSFAPTRRRLPTRSAATIAPQAPYHPPQNTPPPDACCLAHRLPPRLALQHPPSPHNSRLSQPRGESRVAPGPARPQQPRGARH